MWPIKTLAPLLIFCLIASCAQDSSVPLFLIADAAYLSDKSENLDWVSSEEVTYKQGEREVKGWLFMRFKADKDKSTGVMKIGERVGFSTGARFGHKFELQEKDGKRFINITSGEWNDPNRSTVASLEYSIKSDVLVVKDGSIRERQEGGVNYENWAGADVDFAESISFKPGTVPWPSSERTQ